MPGKKKIESEKKWLNLVEPAWNWFRNEKKKSEVPFLNNWTNSVQFYV